MPDYAFYPIAFLLYAALAAYFWRAHWLPTPAGATTAALPRMTEHVMALVPISLHAWLLYLSVFADGAMHLGVGNAISRSEEHTSELQSH